MIAQAFAIGALAALTALLVLLPSWPIRWLLRPLFPQVLFCGSGRALQLAITIDDGPSGPGSRQLLELLDELQVPASFFLIGNHLKFAGPDFVRQALAAGHGIGNHLAEDGVSARLPLIRFIEQLDSTERALGQAAAPLPLPQRWCRPGGGWFHPAMLRALAQRGYRLVLGSVFPWDTFHPPLAFLRWFVLRNVHPGAILVMHDRPDTIAATLSTLRSVIPELRRRGYRFVGLEELTATMPISSQASKS
jgi:peptidoglycan/xylan/chitin deacetylase (PgdA/CDA1 family)